MCQIGAEALLAPQIEATYRLRYRQGGFTLCDIRIEVCQLSLFAALGHGEGKECFPKAIARAIVARLGTADQLPLLTFAQPVLHHLSRRPPPPHPISASWHGIFLSRAVPDSALYHRFPGCSSSLRMAGKQGLF